MKINLNGVLLLNKPLGLSSNTALQKAKQIFNANKAGHTGTLDPLATGLLPICFGEATKFSAYLLDGNKQYIATVKLGVSTTTYDKDGEIVDVRKVDITRDDIIHTVKSFLGKQIQLPPIYSALKVRGKPLYYYARNCIEVEVKSRDVEFIKLELLDIISHDEFKLKIECSKGTYIRSLAHDIGQKLGCGAHLVALQRTKSNEFILNDTITLEYLKRLNQSELESLLLPIDVLVSDLPSINLNVSQYAKIKFGNQFENNSTFYSDEYLRAYFEGQFLGIVKPINSNMFQPVRLINNK